MTRVEIFRGQARRRWSDEEKRRLVAETLVPGETVHVVAQRHGVNTSQLFTWRKRFRAQLGLPAPAPGMPAFAAVEVAPASLYGHHLPLTRQSAIYAREGVEIDVSTLADWVGAVAATAMPLVETIRAHVFAAERIHADDTTVPVLAKEKTRIARLWAYVWDDRPFAGRAPPAAAFFYSRDRGGAHPERHLASFAGLMQADAYAGFTPLYAPYREPGPIVEAACWAHARRKFYELAQVAKAPIAVEAVTRIDRAVPQDAQGGAGLAARVDQPGRPLRCARPLARWLADYLHSAFGYRAPNGSKAQPAATPLPSPPLAWGALQN